MQKEIWKPVYRFEKVLIVSDKGILKRLDYKVKRNYSDKPDNYLTIKGGLVKQTTTKKGYKRITFNYNKIKKSYLVHRLVYEAFYGEIEQGFQINHKNGIKNDNRLENLEKVSQSENIKHRFTNLGQKNHLKGKKRNYSNNKRKVICIETGNIYDSVRSAGLKEGVSSSSVLSFLKGRTKITKKGYTYKYC